MKSHLVPCLLGALSLVGEAGLLINEFSATHSDHLLIREAGEYPRVGNTIPWQSENFDDSDWKSGNGPFGSGVSGLSVGTNVTSEVENLTPSLYLRKTFNVSAGNAGSSSILQLAVRYDDGFIAFLNGVEIARRNMGFPGMFGFHEQPAFNAHAGSATETINVGVASSLLQSGENLLSIQVHNQTRSGGGDLYLDADLKFSSGTVIANGDTSWNYFAGLAEPSGGLVDQGLIANQLAGAPDVSWGTVSFDDSTWATGVGPVGYDISAVSDYLVGVDLQSEMRGVTPSVYVRQSFSVTQAEADSSFPLSLNVDFDDGMIIYLNGFEVFRENVGTAGTPTAFDAVADSNHPATEDGTGGADRSETITLAAANNLLKAGDNILAIQLHNRSTGSSDLVGRAALSTTGASPRDLVVPSDSLRYFVGNSEPAPFVSDDSDVGPIAETADSENDWIEIRNTDAVAVSLDGWSLSDDPTDERKWSFPTGITIPANGYYLVIASGLDLSPGADGTTYVHTNFKLSSSGDRIVLTRPDGLVEDQLVADYPVQSWRYTYGRQADGTFGYLSLGTPGAENVGSALGEAPGAPQFSVAGGFHASSQSVTLTSSTPGATIQYTTDGTDPLEGGIQYSSPIQVSSNTAIRARSFLADAVPSSIVTHTYLIGQSSALQGLGAIVLTGDPEKTFYGPNTENGPAMGEGIFAINGGSYSNSQWSAGSDTSAFNVPMSSGRPSERPAALEYLPTSGESLRTELGIRTAGSGHTRRRLKITDPMDERFTPTDKFEKPSFNIFFRPEFGDRPLEYPFFGGASVTEFENMRIRAGKNDWVNPFIKDELMRRLFISTGQVGSYGSMNTLWINGVYKGYYNLTERVREGFMQTHYNSDEAWDVQQVNQFSSGDPTNWNKMISYLRTTDLTTPAGYAGVHDFLDVDNYIDYILVNAYAATGDWPHNNWIAARERTSLGRWRFYVWDAEGGFGFAGRSTSSNSFTEHLTLPSTRYPSASAMTTTSQYVQAIFTLLNTSPEFKLRMADRAQKHLYNDGALATANIAQIYNELRSEISPVISATVGASFRSSFYTGWIANGARFNALTSQLDGLGAWPSTDAPTLSQHGGEISTGFQLSMNNPNGGGTVYYTTDGADPRSLGGATAGTVYSGPVTLSDDTRVRARVLESGTWSPEIDVNFTLPFANPTFMPLASADWTEDVNWSTSPAAYPNGSGVTAVIPGAEGASRNANMRAPVTVGRLEFELESTTNRSRVRDRNTGNTLTFSNGGNPAEILVTGDQTGYAEVEIEAGTLLVDDLRLDIQHEGGDSDYGALRLRGGVSGVGGLTKAGAGIATLTGDGKSYTGATLVEQGVLQLTEPATPLTSSALAVLAGGQLRLTSGTGSGDPARNYAFGGTLSLSGTGRGIEIAEGNGNGKLGALRYDPGSSNDHAIISSPVSLAAAATVHVEGSSNLLEVSQALTGSSALTKTGGGTLFLNGDQSAQSFPIAVTSGSLEIQGTLGSTIDLSPTATLKGYGSTAAITGEGAVVLNQELLEAPVSNASRYFFTFSSASAPNVNSPSASLNGTAIFESAPTGVLGLNFYLTGSAQGLGSISQGGIIVPSSVDLESALASAEIRVFSADSSGGHQFEGQNWRAVQGFSLAVVETSLGQAAPFSQVRILELTNEESTPGAFEAWQMATFNAAELADPAISGALASPFGDGVNNLLRYALGVPQGESAQAHQPKLVADASGIGIDFPFDDRRGGVSVLLESSDSLMDWSEATVLFHSAVDPPATTIGDGRIRINDERVQVGQRFYRLRVIQN